MNTPESVRGDLVESIETILPKKTGPITKPRRASKASLPEIFQFIIGMEGGSLQKELYHAGLNISASDLVHRREKLSCFQFCDALAVFNELHKDAKTYRGYRVLAVDGTTVNMPRNPDSLYFMTSTRAPKGYCQMHVTPLYDVLNKTYAANAVIQPQPKQDEIGALLYMLAWMDFEEPTIIVGDRLFASYNTLETIRRTPNAFFLIRAKQGYGAMREIGKLPMKELDVDVSFTITTTQTAEDKAQDYVFVQKRKNADRAYSNNTRDGRWDFPSPYPMGFRVIRVLLDTGDYETLVTNLPRTFTPQDAKELYHARWGIEIAFRELKYNLGLVNLHSRKDKYIRQEIYASMIAANFCSRIVNEVIIRQKQSWKYEYKVNQKMAIMLCKEFLRTPGADGAQLMQNIARYIEPVRPGRKDERNLQPKSFPGFVYRVAA